MTWVCGRCAGCAVTMANLRKGVQHQYLQDVWNRTVGQSQNTLLRCPACAAMMHTVPTMDGPEIDLCRKCQTIWFDAGELSALPRPSAREIAKRRWDEEQREDRAARADREFYDRLIRRRSNWPGISF